jgi:acetoin utilization protein AcuB
VLRKAGRPEGQKTRLIDLVGRRSADVPTEALLESVASRVSDVMSERVVTVAVDETLGDALARMRQHDVRHLPVLDGQRRIRGVISDRDLLASLPPATGELHGGRGADPRSELLQVDPREPGVAEALRRPVGAVLRGGGVITTTTPTASVDSAVEMFVTRGIGSLPVVQDGTPGIVGIVTQTDLLRLFVLLGRIAGRGAP